MGTISNAAKWDRAFDVAVVSIFSWILDNWRYTLLSPVIGFAIGHWVLAEKKIPKRFKSLKDRHAFLLIEKDNAWITSPNRELAETFGALIMKGNPVTVGPAGSSSGERRRPHDHLDRKPDGRFKLTPLSVTPNRLLTRVAHFVGRPGSVTSEEGQHGLVFRGELRNPGESVATEATAQEPQPEVAPAAEPPTGGFEKITGADASAPPLGRKSP
jgi:hypothetical protein